MRYRYILITTFVLALALALMTSTSPRAQGGAYVDLAQVTNDKEVDLYPDVAPNGKMVAYMSYQKSANAGRNFDIFVKNATSGQTFRLDTDEADDSFPAWMADGQSIIFDSYRRVDKQAVWKKSIGGGTLAKVTNIPKVAFSADCHYDNVRVVFNATDDGKKIKIRKNGYFWKSYKRKMPNIYIINADGSNLLDLNTQGLQPKWSPDGSRIVFANNSAGNYEIYTIRPDGSDLTRLTTRDSVDIEPAWSPDGRYIVFVSDENKNWNLWLIKPDGTGLSPLTTHDGFEGGPMWATDGYIYFHSDRNGNWDIWRLKPTGYTPIPPDQDGDGIFRDQDQCPEQAEDVDGFEDEDGCPDPDNDNDGVLDADDQCPGQLEDNDGFQDNDGCPDPDNDNDGVLDVDDQCPNEEETANGYLDQDGCPDDPPLQPINTLPISFRVYRSDLNMDSIPVMENLVENLKKWKDAKIAIKVYTDSVQNRNNRRLTQKRADAIKNYLVQRGIEESRLRAIGMGDAEPVASNRTRSGRQKNNRVVIEVLTQ